MNIVIPAAGLGSRFVNAGYSIPKPFLPIKGKTMIEHVVDNVAMPGDKVFIICLVEHLSFFSSTDLLHRGNVCFVPQRGRLQGAVASIFLAKDFINTEEPLIIANSDQWVDYDQRHFRNALFRVDGLIMTFSSSDPKWSYADATPDGRVVKVAEKVVISDKATTGIYGFQHGRVFVNGARHMMDQNITTNGEFYVCPVFNEIMPMEHVYIYPVECMYGMGTPEDLEANYNQIGT